MIEIETSTNTVKLKKHNENGKKYESNKTQLFFSIEKQALQLIQTR